MKKLINNIDRIMQEVLGDSCHVGWEAIFELFFTALADSSDINFGRLVAEAVTDYVCEELPDDFVLSHKDVQTMYAVYANYAGEFEFVVRNHITNNSNLYRVV